MKRFALGLLAAAAIGAAIPAAASAQDFNGRGYGPPPPPPAADHGPDGYRGDRGDRGPDNYRGDRGPGGNDWAFAGPYGPFSRDVARVDFQIRRGVEDGDLTRYEARGLSRELARLKRQIRYAISDGGVSPWERSSIARRLDDLGDRVDVASRDDDAGRDGPGGFGPYQGR
jgi:hypothetical protein